MNTIVNTVAKGLLRGVGFLANVVLNGMKETTETDADDWMAAGRDPINEREYSDYRMFKGNSSVWSDHDGSERLN